MSDETPRVKGFKDFMRRSGWASLAILFVVTGLGAGIYGFIQSTKDSNQNQSQQNDKLTGSKLPGFTPVSKVGKLEVSDIKKGSGKTAKAGSTVTVHYTGALAASGIIFDTSIDRGQPAVFVLKKGNLIDGFYQGMLGMKVGGERKILMPATLGYGAAPPPTSGIPANADLVFEVVLVAVD